MSSNRSYRWGSRIAYAAAALVMLAGLGTLGLGVAAMAGWRDYGEPVQLIPKLVSEQIPRHAWVEIDDWTDFGFTPTWATVVNDVKVCSVPTEPNPLQEPETADCDVRFTLIGGARDTPTSYQPVSVQLSGRTAFDATAGWQPVMAWLYSMAAIDHLVLAAVALLIARCLRDAASDAPFTASAARRLRAMGLLIAGWGIAQPAIWQIISMPRANEIYGGQSNVQVGLLGEIPELPSLTVIGIGLLLILLGQVFAHGARLAEEQKLTV
jgi:Protein of unknown function (DUF2975)